MVAFVTNYNFNWKPVKGSLKKSVVCPRCHNKVEYNLCSDSARFGFLIGPHLKYGHVYAWKCPICPNHEEVSKQVAKAIIRGS
jgi:hypothetical protein